MQKSLFTRTAVVHYPPPLYPQYGYIIPCRIQTSYWSRWPKKRLVKTLITGLFPLAFTGCLTGDISDPSPLSLSEAEARFVLFEKFSRQDLQIAEDMLFSQAQVSFSVDGYDAEKRIGYEYRSTEISDYDEGGEEPGDEAELSTTELAQIKEWNEHDGPYFLFLDQKYYTFSNEEEREAYLQQLESDIDNYLADLVRRGIL
jgi:hypothetical protein